MTTMTTKLSPHEFQKRGADLIVKNGATYLMWDMGVGKTLTAILAIKKLGMQVMVLAPLNAALITWPNELDKWAPELTYTVLHGPNKDHYARHAYTFDVIILNFEGLIWWYNMVKRRAITIGQKFFVIWDESSLLKNHRTKRWQIMAEALPIWSPYRVHLSGTPMPKSLSDLWAQYFLLDEGKRLTADIWSFRNRWFTWEAKTYTSKIKPGAEKQIFKRISDITDRLDGEDYLELPKEVHNNVTLQLTPALRKLYTKFEEEFVLEFPRGLAEANSKAVLHSKLRQFLQGAVYTKQEIGQEPTGEYEELHTTKLRHLKHIVDNNAGSPVLAAVQFSFEYEMACRYFSYKIPIIAGRTSPKRAAQLVQQWNEGTIPLLMAHPRSIAYSLNLQFGGHTICWLALPWELDLYQQLIRRLRRQGQKSNRVIVHRFIFENTVDERVAKGLVIKNVNQEQLFNAMTQRYRKGR